MSRIQDLLTAKALYAILSKGTCTVQESVSFLSCYVRYTQNKFWGNFLSECVTDTVVNHYFLTQERRSRSLSNVMNRTCTHSMPLKLYRALEESLDDENFVCMVVWTAAALEQSINPLIIHAAFTEYEDKVLKTDPWFEQVAPFFIRTRPVVNRNGTYHLKKMFLQAAFRLTMLGLHALYGDRMLESAALKKLRSSSVCNMEVLWKQSLSISPRISKYDFSRVHAVENTINENPPAQPIPIGNIEWITKRFQQSLPPEEILKTADPVTGGWYVAANWLDQLISVNDIPAPTYEGANQLAEITNGTIMFVLFAPGYKGLHVSSGIWGKVIWEGRVAWIPMNLMVKIV